MVELGAGHRCYRCSDIIVFICVCMVVAGIVYFNFKYIARLFYMQGIFNIVLMQ